MHRPPALGTIVLPAIGFGYTVTSQGPLDASQFPTGSPSASAAAGALSTLGNTIETYQRSWQDATGVNQVQDLVVRFPTDAGAGAFVGAARRAIAHGEIVSSGPLRSIPGAQRTTYFASTNQAGVGQTITMRSGRLRRRALLLLGCLGQPGTDHAGRRLNGLPRRSTRHGDGGGGSGTAKKPARWRFRC